MPVLSNTIRNPGKVDIFNLQVTVELLWDASVAAIATVPDIDVSIAYVYILKTDDAGFWSLDVVSNADIEPSGSVYKIAEGDLVYYVQLTDDQDAWVGDILVDKPEWVV